MKERTKFLLEWERRWHEGEGRLNFESRRRIASCQERLVRADVVVLADGDATNGAAAPFTAW